MTREDQEVISEDQKHSSTVAKIHYKKKQSRTIAMQGRQCMEKMIGDTRETNKNISEILSELKTLNSEFNHSVIRKSADILQHQTNNQSFGNVETTPYEPICTATDSVKDFQRIETSPYKATSCSSATTDRAEHALLQVARA